MTLKISGEVEGKKDSIAVDCVIPDLEMQEHLWKDLVSDYLYEAKEHILTNFGEQRTYENGKEQ